MLPHPPKNNNNNNNTNAEDILTITFKLPVDFFSEEASGEGRLRPTHFTVIKMLKIKICIKIYQKCVIFRKNCKHHQTLKAQPLDPVSLRRLGFS